MVRTSMRGCLRSMENITHRLIDLDMTSRLMMIEGVIQDAISEGIIDENEEETLVNMWITELRTLDNIKENIEAQELLTENQKEYIWSIVMGGV